MMDEDARIEDGLGRCDRSRNTSGSVRLDRNAKEAAPERFVAHKKVMAVANEIVAGGLGRKASSKDCITALEHELQLQQSDDHIVQMDGKYKRAKVGITDVRLVSPPVHRVRVCAHMRATCIISNTET